MNKLLKQIEEYKLSRNMNNLRETRWLYMFFELSDFKSQNGHTNVPARYKKHKALGYWTRKQRCLYTSGNLDVFRESLLKTIGFNFRLLVFHNWDDMFNKLVEFKRQFGHVRLTAAYKDTQLHDWLTYQRKLHWRKRLDRHKLNHLKSLGVDMSNKTLDMWDIKFEQLVNFKLEHGHLYVCKYYTQNKQLINFVKVIRRDQEKLSDKRRKKLNDIGFVWEPGKKITRILNQKRAKAIWMEHFEELKEYKVKKGTSYIPAKDIDNPTLGNWVSMQRYKTERLSKEQFLLLDSIGFWDDNSKILGSKWRVKMPN